MHARTHTPCCLQCAGAAPAWGGQPGGGHRVCGVPLDASHLHRGGEEQQRV